MNGFVLDNSVAMRWCFEENSAYAEKVLDEIIAGGQAYAPALWLYEVISVMAGSQRRGTLTADKAHSFFEDLRSLDIEVESETRMENVFGAVHGLAVQFGLSGYDAAYLELALRKGLPLASLDDDLNEAARTAGVELIEL